MLLYRTDGAQPIGDFRRDCDLPDLGQYIFYAFPNDRMIVSKNSCLNNLIDGDPPSPEFQRYYGRILRVKTSDSERLNQLVEAGYATMVRKWVSAPIPFFA